MIHLVIWVLLPKSAYWPNQTEPFSYFCWVCAVHDLQCGLTFNIGYPKLFMSCQRAIGKLAQQVVNNFAANRAATVSDWLLGFIFGIGSSGFPAPAGQVC